MSEHHPFSIPPASTGGANGSGLVIPFTATMGARKGQKVFYVSAVGDAARLWEYALLTRKLEATGFKVKPCAESGLYLSREITEEEYEKL